VPGKLVLRSDNGLVFTSGRYTTTVKAYELSQEFITPYTLERFIRTLKEECLWQHGFESLAQAREVIRSWIRYYNLERPHQDEFIDAREDVFRKILVYGVHL